MLFIMLWLQVRQAVLLLKQLWPEGSDIRRVVCVLSCAVGLTIYSNMLENADTSMGAKTKQSARVRIFKIFFQHSDHKHFANRREMAVFLDPKLKRGLDDSLVAALSKRSGSDNYCGHSFSKGTWSVCGWHCAPCCSGYSWAKFSLRSNYCHRRFYLRRWLRLIIFIFLMFSSILVFTGEHAFPQVSKTRQKKGFFLDMILTPFLWPYYKPYIFIKLT